MAKKIFNYKNTYPTRAEYNAAEKDYPNVSYISGENLVLFERYAPSPVDYSTSFTGDSLTMWFGYSGDGYICKDNTTFESGSLPEGFPLNGEFFTGNLSIYKEGNDEALYTSPLTEVSMNKVNDHRYIRMVISDNYKDTLGLVVVDDCYHLQEFGGFQTVFSAISTEISEGDNIRIEITDIVSDGGMWYNTMSDSEPIEILRFYGTEVMKIPYDRRSYMQFGYRKGAATFQWSFNDLPEYQTGDDEYTIPIASELRCREVYLYQGSRYYQKFVDLFTSGSALVYNNR